MILPITNALLLSELLIAEQASKSITEGYVLEIVIGILGFIVSILIIALMKRLGETTTALIALKEAIIKDEEKFKNFSSNCEIKHANLLNLHNGFEEKMDYYEKVQMEHDKKIAVIEVIMKNIKSTLT